MTTTKMTVKAQIPLTLYKALQKECDSCGCSMSAVINDAIVRKVRDMANTRRVRDSIIAGQQGLKLGS